MERRDGWRRKETTEVVARAPLHITRGQSAMCCWEEERGRRRRTTSGMPERQRRLAARKNGSRSAYMTGATEKVAATAPRDRDRHRMTQLTRTWAKRPFGYVGDEAADVMDIVGEGVEDGDVAVGEKVGVRLRRSAR